MGSGMGKTSTRGHKGQGSRSGSSQMRGFEGGQMPLHRRMPKRGFTNIHRVEYALVNLTALATLEAVEITPAILYQAKLVRNKRLPIKVLGDGELTAAVKVQAHKFSKTAQEKITRAGGTVDVIERKVAPVVRHKAKQQEGKQK